MRQIVPKCASMSVSSQPTRVKNSARAANERYLHDLRAFARSFQGQAIAGNTGTQSR
jgi:hypothetical protein